MNNINNPFVRYQSSIQLAAFHYIVCMKAQPSNDDSNIKYNGMEYSFKNIEIANPTDLHGNFQVWATCTIIRYLIEEFSIFLSEKYKEIYKSNESIKYKFNPDRFEGFGLENQLNIIFEVSKIDKFWIEIFIAFNRMRNCLAHRGGLVSEKDCNQAGLLAINYVSSKLIEI